MNGLLKTGAASLLAIALAFPTVGVARTVLNLTDKPVAFSHTRHAAFECASCHGATPAATAPTSAVQMTLPMSCHSCHEITTEKPPSDGCANCHNDVSI